MAIDILLRLIGSDTGVKSMFAGAREEGEKLNETVLDINTRTEALNASFEKARNWGAGMAVGGAAALALASNLAEVYREGARADEKLSAMMRKRGEGAAEQIEDMANWAGELAYNAAMIDDDPIKEAAAGLYGFGLNGKQVQEILPGLIGQSRLYGQSLDSVAQAFGRAYASGNASALKRSGVTLSQADLDYIEAATSEIEKQHRMFEKVSESMQKYALSMTEGLSESEKAVNRIALEMDNLQTSIGKGSAEAKEGVDNIVASLLRYLGASSEAAEGAGWIMTIAGYFGVAGGSVLTFIGQVGMAQTALAGMGITGTASFGAMSAAALPLLIVLGKILLVALLAAAAIYALDKAFHWREDKELEENIKAGDEDSRKLYELRSAKLRKEGKPVPTYEQWQSDPNADDTSSAGDASEIADLKRQYDAMQNAPAVPVPAAAYTPSITPIIDAPDSDKARAAAQKSASAQAKADEQLKDRIAKRQADIEIATINEMYETRIAQLEASKPKKGDSSAVDRQIQKVRAEQTIREAEIRAKHDDAYAESGQVEIARIRARGMTDRAGIRSAGIGAGSSGNAAIDGITAARGGFGVQRSGAGRGAASSGGGTFNVNLAEHVRVGMDAGGNYVLNFVGQVLLPQPRIATNVNGLRS